MLTLKSEMGDRSNRKLPDKIEIILTNYLNFSFESPAPWEILKGLIGKDKTKRITVGKFAF